MEISKRYNSVPVKDNCALFAPTPLSSGPGYALVSCKFLPWRPCCHGNQPFLFKDKIGCRLTRASNAETELL